MHCHFDGATIGVMRNFTPYYLAFNNDVFPIANQDFLTYFAILK